VRRHHDLRRQAQADRHRLRRGGDRGGAGRPRDPPGHEDPAQVLDQHRRARWGRGRPELSEQLTLARTEPIPDGAIAHLRRADPVLREVIDRIESGEGLGERAGRRGLRPDDHYGALVRSIVGQQLSTKAARAIYERLLGHFGDHTPTPEEVLAADPEQMRAAAGLSRSKVSFLRSLAEHVIDGSLELERLDELPDEEVTTELVAVKGLGPWTADMFLLFHLQRPDVLAVGDLGIRRAAMIAYELEELPTPEELTAIAEPWRPFRSVACRYLWRSLDATPV
jgi:DNA-3-methyladenine glycosylase II